MPRDRVRKQETRQIAQAQSGQSLDREELSDKAYCLIQWCALSENIKRGQRQKLKNGIWPQLAPIGYLNDRVRRTIAIDPERGPLVKKAFELYATGKYTFDSITSCINEAGLRTRDGLPLSRSQCHRMMSNPIYCGIIHYVGESYDGAHEALISKELFDAVQNVTQRKSKPKSASKLKPYLYRGLLRCEECGCFITTETQKGHNYLRCTKRVKRDCSQPYAREDAVQQQVGRYLQALAAPTRAADWMISTLEQEQREESSAASQVISQMRQKIADVAHRIQRLMDAYMDQALSVDEFRSAKNTLIETKKKLQQQLAELENQRDGWFESAVTFIKAIKQANFAASSQDDAEKLEFARKTGSNFFLSNRELVVEPREAWQLVVGQRFRAFQTTAPVASTGAEGTNFVPSEYERRGGDSLQGPLALQQS